MLLPKHVTYLIPTKDRPQEIRRFLRSVLSSTVHPGEIILVDGGASIADVLPEFPSLKIRHFECLPPSQLRQRNLGLTKLAPECTHVVYFDDDIVVDPNALEKMLTFWNQSNSQYAGVAFNIVNERGFRPSLFKQFFGMSGRKPGLVLASGYNTNLWQATSDLEVEWVFGGATMWKKEILLSYPREDWYGRYAFVEDVEFSLLVSEKHKLALCAAASVHHLHAASAYHLTQDFGFRQVMARIELARRHRRLSVPKALWASAGQTLENLIRVLLNRNLGYARTALGNVRGLAAAMRGQAANLK